MKNKSNGFIQLEHDLMHTVAWQSLPAMAVCILIYIWSLHNGRNNGEIICSIRMLERRFGIGRRRAIDNLRVLENRGFLVSTRRGSFLVKTGSFIGRATTWRLTMESCNGKPATHEYRAWTPPNKGKINTSSTANIVPLNPPGASLKRVSQPRK